GFVERGGTGGRLARGLRDAAALEKRIGHEAEDGGAWTGPGSGGNGRGRGSVELAHPDLLARRTGAADNLAAGGDPGARPETRRRLQPRHLPDASDRPQPDADALAQAPRRRPAPSALEGDPA